MLGSEVELHTPIMQPCNHATSTSSVRATVRSTSHAIRMVAPQVALELADRTDDGAATAETMALIERRVATMAPVQQGYRIVSTHFLRSRAERRARGLRAVLIEYRFRLLAES